MITEQDPAESGQETHEFIAHLPGMWAPPNTEWNVSASLGPLRAATAGPVVLRTMTYDDWSTLDAGYGDAFDYEQSKPLFLTCEITGGRGEWSGPDRESRGSFERIAAIVYDALLLAFGHPLPNPNVSCRYARSAGTSRGLSFTVGASGREWIVSGHYLRPRYELPADGAAKLNAAIAVLRCIDDRPIAYAIRGAFQALRLVGTADATSSMGYSPKGSLGLVISVAALEALLLDDGKPEGEGIRARLARRLGILLGEPAVAGFRSIYDWRSDVLHGRGTLPPFRKPTQTGAALLASVLRRLLAAGEEPWFDGGVGVGLDQIGSEPELQSRFAARLMNHELA